MFSCKAHMLCSFDKSGTNPSSVYILVGSPHRFVFELLTKNETPETTITVENTERDCVSKMAIFISTLKATSSTVTWLLFCEYVHLPSALVALWSLLLTKAMTWLGKHDCHPGNTAAHNRRRDLRLTFVHKLCFVILTTSYISSLPMPR